MLISCLSRQVHVYMWVKVGRNSCRLVLHVQIKIICNLTCVYHAWFFSILQMYLYCFVLNCICTVLCSTVYVLFCAQLYLYCFVLNCICTVLCSTSYAHILCNSNKLYPQKAALCYSIWWTIEAQLSQHIIKRRNVGYWHH